MVKSALNPVFSARPKSIFPTMSALANQYDAINLGQGFPDEDGPDEILKIAADALNDGPNQYVPVEGIQALRNAVAADNKRFYDLDIDPDKEVLVVSGATEGLAAAFFGFLERGDEAIIFAPFYECYAPQIEAAGGVVRVIDLKPPHWNIDAQDLDNAINDRTKLIVLNSPHNPLGKVVSASELALIADAARKHDLLVVSDEVYEHLIYDGRPHVSIMTLPGMFERTIRIGSAGKTFSVTGWRIGYVTGPADLITGVMKAHQHLAYTSPSHLQIAVAKGLELADSYFQEFTANMQAKRDFLATAFGESGFDVLPCQGTYFLTVDIRSVDREDDMAFCKEIAEHAKVAAVPLSAFYHPTSRNISRNYVRFCFCKKKPILSEAATRLSNYLNK